jgi:hypothetical protein
MQPSETEEPKYRSLHLCLDELLPQRRIRPTEVLALWFGKSAGCWMSAESARWIVTRAYPLCEKDARVDLDRLVVYMRAMDGSEWKAFDLA